MPEGQTQSDARPTLGVAMWRGARLRCPRCDARPLYPGGFAFHAHCRACNTDFDESGEWTGAVMVTKFVAGLVLIFGVFALAVGGAPVPVQIAWIAAFAVAFPLLVYRSIKGAWMGVLVATARMGRR